MVAERGRERIARRGNFRRFKGAVKLEHLNGREHTCAGSVRVHADRASVSSARMQRVLRLVCRRQPLTEQQRCGQYGGNQWAAGMHGVDCSAAGLDALSDRGRRQ